MPGLSGEAARELIARRVAAFAHGEGEDVCGAVVLAEATVQVTDERVVNQHDGQLGVRLAERLEHSARIGADVGNANAGVPGVTEDGDWHVVTRNPFPWSYVVPPRDVPPFFARSASDRS